MLQYFSNDLETCSFWAFLYSNNLLRKCQYVGRNRVSPLGLFKTFLNYYVLWNWDTVNGLLGKLILPYFMSLIKKH